MSLDIWFKIKTDCWRPYGARVKKFYQNILSWLGEPIDITS